MGNTGVCAGWFAPLLFANPRRQVILRGCPYDGSDQNLDTSALAFINGICVHWISTCNKSFVRKK